MGEGGKGICGQQGSAGGYAGTKTKAPRWTSTGRGLYNAVRSYLQVNSTAQVLSGSVPIPRIFNWSDLFCML